MTEPAGRLNTAAVYLTRDKTAQTHDQPVMPAIVYLTGKTSISFKLQATQDSKGLNLMCLLNVRFNPQFYIKQCC